MIMVQILVEGYVGEVRGVVGGLGRDGELLVLMVVPAHVCNGAAYGWLAGRMQATGR